jgi:type I restriction enzyme S subunit
LLIANVAQEGSIDKITKATLINQENILLGMHIVVLRAKIEIDPLFFVYYINNFLRRDLYRYIQGSTVAHLYFSHYKHVMMRIPKDVEQQRKISNYLASIDEHIEWLNLKILKRNGKKNS